jgi:drug/metabolite transporter (DMT)-like permease
MTCDVSRRYCRSRARRRHERYPEQAPGGGGPAGCGTSWLPGRVPVTALVWALAAAVLYGTGAALQQRQAAATPSQAAGRPRLFLLLVRRPWWLLGICAELGGFATHAVALRTGPLTIVQMLIASSLLFSVATVRLWSGRRLGWTAWAAVLAVIAGIASFVALASPAGGDAGVPGHAGLAAACLAAGAVPLTALGLAAGGSRRAVLLAVAAGLADAGIAVVTMAFSHAVSGGLTGMAGSWATYALMLGGPCSLLLTQTAYQAGRPMITLPVIAVVTPVASLVTGSLLLGEPARPGALGGAVAALAVLVTSAGLVMLARLAAGPTGPAAGARPQRYRGRHAIERCPAGPGERERCPAHAHADADADAGQARSLDCRIWDLSAGRRSSLSSRRSSGQRRPAPAGS